MTRAGSEIWTFPRISRARSGASESDTPSSANTSVNWSPIRIDGFSAAVGFW